MRTVVSALALFACLLSGAHRASAVVYTGLSPATFESILKSHGAKVWPMGRYAARVRIMDAEDFEIRYLRCDELREPDWICAYSIDKIFHKLHLTPEQANAVNSRLALGRIYVLAADDGDRKRGDVVLDYTVSLSGGVTDTFILKSFGEMIQGIEDHFDAALDDLKIEPPYE